MFGKFRPPLLKSTDVHSSHLDSAPPAKRQKVDVHSSLKVASGSNQSSQSTGRQPLTAISNPPISRAPSTSQSSVDCYYSVLWRKFTTKKHKTWDGDGLLSVSSGFAFLRDISGQELGKVVCDTPLLPGSTLSIAGKDVEIDTLLSKDEYTSRIPGPSEPGIETSCKFPPSSGNSKKGLALQVGKTYNAESKMPPTTKVPTPTMKLSTAFKTPLLRDDVMPKVDMTMPTPRHDPLTSGALVMQRPSRVQGGQQIVDVVVDPVLSRHLRPHQKEGVKFLYESVMGLREDGQFGAVLADEMGLGKTLQTISVLWTLLKQNMIHGSHPVVKKALVACPVTLIKNWRKEFRKWLGADRLGILTFDDSRKRITDFTRGKAYSILIIGYEKLRAVSDELRQSKCVDIVVADEGHRLKNAKNKSAQAIKDLEVPRKILLTGTPIMNDLGEFFVMADFVNPGVLGYFKAFTKNFEVPIIRSRQPEALGKDRDKGKERADELAVLTKSFILRRTADLLAEYLPSKSEYVLMCRPTPSQASIYRHVLQSPVFKAAVGGTEMSLKLITALKKLCNSPWLLNNREGQDHDKAASDPILQFVPSHLIRNNQGSTKLRVLDRLLYTLKNDTNERIVLVSNYTSTLRILESLLTTLGYPYVRLDGSTPSKKRQDLVDDFNRPTSPYFAFLLSAKAGGVGINLIGASRLVLFDVDWNPATDLQAMARIHRDGQKRPCIIYRFLLAGGIDEKIWQRQVTKLGLASNVMDQQNLANSFSQAELRDLFRLDEGPTCQTHDLLGCRCNDNKAPIVSARHLEESETGISMLGQFSPANKVDIPAQERHIMETASSAKVKEGEGSTIEYLKTFSHIDTCNFAANSLEDRESLIGDEVLQKVLEEEENPISFVFAKTTNG